MACITNAAIGLQYDVCLQTLVWFQAVSQPEVIGSPIGRRIIVNKNSFLTDMYSQKVKYIFLNDGITGLMGIYYL
jgi:hypothetical protein